MHSPWVVPMTWKSAEQDSKGIWFSNAAMLRFLQFPLPHTPNQSSPCVSLCNSNRNTRNVSKMSSSFWPIGIWKLNRFVSSKFALVWRFVLPDLIRKQPGDWQLLVLSEGHVCDKEIIVGYKIMKAVVLSISTSNSKPISQ